MIKNSDLVSVLLVVESSRSRLNLKPHKRRCHQLLVDINAWTELGSIISSLLILLKKIYC